MFKTLFMLTLVAISSVQVSKADLADDAETALNNLRQALSDNLNGAFLEHIKLSTEVDNVALDTKEAALKTKCLQKTINDVNSCVDIEADKAVDIIFKGSSDLTTSFLEKIYVEEKNIVHCGRADEDCLNNVIDSIVADVDALPVGVNDEIEKDRQAVEAQIEVIKACASESAQMKC